MKFSTKIFYAISLTTILLSSLFGFLVYSVISNDMKLEYISHYQSLGTIIGDTFKQLEILTDQINETAIQTLYETQSHKGLPTNKELTRLMNNLGVSSFHIANYDGTIIRSTEHSPSIPAENIFSFCRDYRMLTHGNKNLFRTPIIPDSFYKTPSKFIMVPNHNRKLVLESGIELPYIGKLFQSAINSDKNIKLIGLYTPIGSELGYISENGEYHQGRKNTLLNLNEIIANNIIIKNQLMIFNIRIPATDPYCCECIYKKVTNVDGSYYYNLKLYVSLHSLVRNISLLKKKLLLILFLASIFSIIISKFLASKLVNRIERINKTAADIIESKNLDLRVTMKKDSDEIAELADTFNKMIQSLKISQIRLVESEKKTALLDLAASVAHDIRSPLAAMEMTLSIISNNIPITQRALLSDAIQSVRDIANNLLIRYRQSEPEINSCKHKHETIRDDGNIPRYLLLSNIIESIISQKRQEWQNNPCNISLTVSSKAKSIWIHCVPNDLKRNLSNLLNNAYESLDKCREIHLELDYKNQLLLRIKDNGIGIPTHQIQNVLLGKSLKHNGKGLGLSNAKQYMENIKGKLILSSIHNEGTEITLMFPPSTKPAWFPDAINIPIHSIILILDDDSCMHSLWRQRLQTNGLKYLHFLQSSNLVEWCQQNPNSCNNAIFLFDYHIQNDLHNGLELLEKFDAKSRGYLITSHAEEIIIQKRCEQIGIWLIPKVLAGEIALLYHGNSSRQTDTELKRLTLDQPNPLKS